MANLVAEQEMFFNTFEPKMTNRFIMFMDGVPSFMVKGVQRPNLSQDAKVLPHINLVRYVKGRTTWGTMNFTLYDPVVPSGAQSVMEWVRLHHESLTGRDGYADFYKKDLVFNMLGPLGDKVEEWIIKGAQITAVDFGEANWDSDEVINATITIQPDFCILNF